MLNKNEMINRVIPGNTEMLNTDLSQVRHEHNTKLKADMADGDRKESTKMQRYKGKRNTLVAQRRVQRSLPRKAWKTSCFHWVLKDPQFG